ncbi:hypothetical protein JHK86_008234 [Glycine max]|nr:hypothetical protein JHK86_008234 [Glycine max]
MELSTENGEVRMKGEREREICCGYAHALPLPWLCLFPIPTPFPSLFIYLFVIYGMCFSNLLSKCVKGFK